MAKKKLQLSPGDKLSIFIASVALASAVFTTYIQFFHKTTDLRIGNIDITNVSDSSSKKLDINILLLNTGTNPAALTEWYSFLSSNDTMTDGTCYNNDINPDNTAIYTFGCGSNINEIFEPNVVDFVNLRMEISNSKLSGYTALNDVPADDQSPNLNLGVYMKFVDSNGKKVNKELIIGSIQFNEFGSNWTTFKKNQKELTIY